MRDTALHITPKPFSCVWKLFENKTDIIHSFDGPKATCGLIRLSFHSCIPQHTLVIALTFLSSSQSVKKLKLAIF